MNKETAWRVFQCVLAARKGRLQEHDIEFLTLNKPAGDLFLEAMRG